MSPGDHNRWVIQLGALTLVAGVVVLWLAVGTAALLDAITSLPVVLAWLIVALAPAVFVVVVVTVLELGDELLRARRRRRAPVELVQGRPRVGEVRVRPGGRVGGRPR